jgi:hypothetical protein
MNSGNALYNSVENNLSCSLLPKNMTINIYRTITLHVELYGYETSWSTLRDELLFEGV